MNLSQIEAFRAVVLSGSTTAAAGVLHTSQPNVSRLVAQLEKAIGLRLFDRSPGKLSLTQEGHAFFEEVQRSFLGLEQLDEAAGRIRRFGTGLLRIAAVSTIALGLLPRAVKRFAQLHPEVGISIHMGHSSVIAQWVDAHFCDLGIVSHAPPRSHPAESDLLFRLDSVCLMPQGHRLAGKGRLVPADFAGEAFISLARDDEMRRLVDRVFDEAGVQRSMTVETPYSSIICSLVAQGMGVSVVNPLAAHDYRAAPVTMRPMAPAVPCEGILIHPRARPRNRLAHTFAEVLQRVAREECTALGAGQAVFA